MTNQAQTVSGMRISVMPGARMSIVVEMKFTELSSDAKQKIKMLTIHIVWPIPSPGPVTSPRPLSGGYAVQPLIGAPPGTTNAAIMQRNATTVSQNESIFSRGKAISGAPI